jgi:hypothetical protein
MISPRGYPPRAFRFSGPAHSRRYNHEILLRLRLIVGSSALLTLWLFGYLALEWLFHATKPSLVASASGPVQLFLLIVTPAAFLAWLLPAQVVLALVDSLRREALARWLAALLPAAIVTVTILMLAENFTRTVFDYSVSDSRGVATALYLAAFLFLALWMWQRQALALATRPPRRATIVVAAALALVSTVVALASRFSTSEILAVVTRQDAARRPNILLVGFDGVTASATPAYGAAGSTPHFDSLVRRGILFENAFSNAGRTYTSVTSLLTGKLPIETSLFTATYLDGAETIEHLPLLLRSAGYTNVQVGIGLHVDANDANMRGGFEMVNGRPGLPGRAPRDVSKVRDRLELYRAALVKRVADRLPHILFLRTMHDEYRFLVGQQTDVPHFADSRRIELARAFIEERRQPWFLHVHLLGSHGCREQGCRPALTQTDASLGQLIAALRATQQLERTLIIVYSDHSETWGTTERLPLVIAPPGELRPQRVRNNVQLADVAPTILDHLGLPKAPWMSGVSLLAQEPPPGRPIISLEPFEDATRSAGIVVCDRWGTIDFATWTFRSGTVAGHTAPCADSGFEQKGRAMLLEALRRNGYLSRRSR